MKGTRLLTLTILLGLGLLVSASAWAQKGAPFRGKPLYQHYCTVCHGSNGKGDGINSKYLDTKPADHTDGEFMSAKSDQELFDAVALGGLAVGKSNLMPPWRYTLKEQQVWDLVAFMRSLHPKVKVAPPPEEEKKEEKEEKKKELF